MLRFKVLILCVLAMISARAQDSDASLSSQSTTEIRNKTYSPSRADDFNQDMITAKQSIIPVVNTSGTNTYTASIHTGVTAYTSGLVVYLRISNSSTGNCTLNLNSIGAKKIYIDASTQVGNTDLIAQHVYMFSYDTNLDGGAGGFLQIGSNIPNGDKGDITVSGATWTIDNLAVTNAKINDVAYSKITGVPANLSDIAGATYSNDDFVQKKAGALTNRTIAQVKSDLGLSGTNTGDQTITLTGDVTGSGTGSFAATLATVNSNTGTFGGATTSPQLTVNGKGLLTAVSSVTITPAIGSITGLGTGIATALAVNVGSAGAPVLFNGAGGTPSSITLTNATGFPYATGGTGAVPIANGGTGQTSKTSAYNALSPNTTQGDITYFDGTNNVRLAKSATATRYLSNTGTSNNPAWAQVDLTNGVTGVLPSANGGLSGTSAGGDLSGTYPNPTVAKIQTIAFSATTPTTGQIPQYNGVSWSPTSTTAGAALTGYNCVITGNGSTALVDAASIVTEDTEDVTGAITLTATSAKNQDCVSGGSYTVTLPALASVTGTGWQGGGKVFHIANLQSSGTITIAQNGSETIDGSTSDPTLATQYKYLRIQAKPSGWIIRGSN